MVSIEVPPPTLEVTSPPRGGGRTIFDDTSQDAASGSPVPAPGQRIGRFLVRGVLGSGGMGVVVRAYDERLDRDVAIKVLHPEASRRHMDRLLREAQALARLSHPNVVQIYEVGTVGDRTFIAMELIVGSTLDGLRKERRPWRSTVALYLQAARGLAAAHDKGLVHRDFKPDNCILGDDGRVRVVDFGLVREVVRPPQPRAPGDGPGAPGPGPPSGRGPFGERLTGHGVVLGTLAYMSMEQLMSRPTDARTDQYSWCASLYEALYGELPYPAETLASLMGAMVADRRSTPTGVELPRRLRRALWRGLSIDPAKRWPTMEALVAELEALMRRRRWWPAGITLGLGVGLGVALALTRSPPGPCATADTTLDGAWDDQARDRLAAAFAAHGPPDADTLRSRIVAQLDQYAEAWGNVARQSCAATFVTHRQSQMVFELRARCLERRRNHAVLAVEMLTEAEGTESLVQSAILPFTLPDPARCADVDAVMGRGPRPQESPPDERRVDLRRRLDRADSLRESGRFEPALALAEEVRDEAQALGAPRLHAEALEHLGRIQAEGVSAREAKATLEQAIVEASRVGDDEVVARAWLSLVYADTTLQALEEAKHHTLGASAAVERVDDDLLRAWLLNDEGIVASQDGDRPAAEQHLEQALELKSRVLGPAHVDVGVAWLNLGMVLHRFGEHRKARPAIEKAEAIFEATVGRSHPNTLHALSGRCGVELAMRNFDLAVTLCRSALARLAAFPVAPVLEGRIRFLLAQALWKLGRGPEARDEARRAARAIEVDDPGFARMIETWILDPDAPAD